MGEATPRFYSNIHHVNQSQTFRQPSVSFVNDKQTREFDRSLIERDTVSIFPRVVGHGGNDEHIYYGAADY
jgi:hypothetical protein